jgi:hypothetical protein
MMPTMPLSRAASARSFQCWKQSRPDQSSNTSAQRRTVTLTKFLFTFVSLPATGASWLMMAA